LLPWENFAKILLNQLSVRCFCFVKLIKNQSVFTKKETFLEVSSIFLKTFYNKPIMLKKDTEIWTSKLPFLNEKEAQELATTISFFWWRNVKYCQKMYDECFINQF
jgi:hypothetical protein